MARVKAYTYRRNGKIVSVGGYTRRGGSGRWGGGFDYLGQPFNKPGPAPSKVRISGKRMLDDPTFSFSNKMSGVSKLKHTGGRRRGPTSLKAVTAHSRANALKSKMDLSKAAPDYSGLAVSDIAREIQKEWGGQKGGVNFAARPYLDAMRTLNSFDEHFGMDSGRSIGHYFLSNASQFRGPKAKALKAELKRRLK